MATRVTRGYQMDVLGLNEFIQALRGEPERLDKELRKRLEAIAEDVASEARTRAGARTNPRVGHEVMGTIKASSAGRDARVSLGANNVPWALGHEFGSVMFPQFPPWTGNDRGAGLFFYPAVREASREDIPKALHELIEEFASRVYPD